MIFSKVLQIEQTKLYIPNKDTAYVSLPVQRKWCRKSFTQTCRQNAGMLGVFQQEKFVKSEISCAGFK